MKLTRLSGFKTSKACYLIEPIFDGKILINDCNRGFSILDKNLNVECSVSLSDKTRFTVYYLSEDRSHFLWYTDGEDCLYYINLRNSISGSIKCILPKDFSVGSYYIWENGSFIIAGWRGHSFLKYLVDDNRCEILDSFNILNRYPGFKIALELEKTYYMLYQDIKRQVFIYRTVGDKDNIIYWKDFITNKEIQFPAPAIDIFAAEYLDDLLILMHEEYVFFYDLDKEIYRLEVKDPFFSMYTRLFKKDGNTYAVSLTGKINPPYQSRIKLYRIDDYKQSIWKRIIGFFKKN